MFNNQSQAMNKQVENHIKNVVNFWFPDTSFQEFWFSSEYDSIIRVKFNDLWTKIKNLSYDQLNDILVNSLNKNTIYLGIIIVLDQFTRNILRSDDRNIYSPTDNLCMEFIEKSNISDNLFPIHQRIFLLIPYRHQRKTILLDMVMREIQKMEHELDVEQKCVENNNSEKESKQEKINRNILQRFKIATIRDYSKVTDTIVHLTNINLQSVDSNSADNKEKQLINKFYHVLDKICVETYDKTPSDSVSKLVTHNIYCETLKFLREYNIRNVCISLSGGVDSMVLSFVLNFLKKNGHIDNLCAVHVDYGNRHVSRDEASVTENWCGYLGIPYITRRIEHIKRESDNPIDRQLYESETKNIRFNLYRHAIKLYEVQSVMLGHHRDDLSENVLMNVLRGGNILDLFTMKPHQILDGVPISRPMLGLIKESIYDIAHRYHIPYLIDTTPEDCFRGVVRKVLIPSLQKIDPNVLMKVNTIGTSSNEWNDVVNQQVIDPIINSIKVHPHGFSIPFKQSYITLNSAVWKKILSTMFHKNNIKMISNKNMINFMNWLKHRSTLTRFSNDHMAMIHTTSNNSTELFEYLLIVRCGLVSKIQDTQYTETGKVIPQRFELCETKQTTVIFNGWTITISPPVQQSVDMFNKMNYLDLLNGSFQYQYRICKHTSGDLNVSYLVGKKGSDSRRFFDNQNITKYIPNIEIGKVCDKCKNDEVMIRLIRYNYGGF